MGNIAFNIFKDVDLIKDVDLNIDKDVNINIDIDNPAAFAEADAEAFGDNPFAETDAFTYVTNNEAFAYSESTSALDLGDVVFQIDQRNDDFEPAVFQSVLFFSPIGQEFVPQFDSLNVVELFTSDFDSVEDPLLVNIRENDISGSIIGTSNVVVVPSDFKGVTRFEFDNDVLLTPNNTYVIEIVPQSGSNVGIGSSGGSNSTYPFGDQILSGVPQPNNDLWFIEEFVSEQMS